MQNVIILQSGQFSKFPEDRIGKLKIKDKKNIFPGPLPPGPKVTGTVLHPWGGNGNASGDGRSSTEEL